MLASIESSPPLTPPENESAILIAMYRNVDLELRSRERLDSLVTALADRVLVLHHSRERRRSFLCLTVHGSGLDRLPGRTLRRWFELLRALRGEPRRLFRASRVLASIGYEADEAHSTAVVVEPADVAALARLGVGIEVVVYARDDRRDAQAGG